MKFGWLITIIKNLNLGVFRRYCIYHKVWNGVAAFVGCGQLWSIVRCHNNQLPGMQKENALCEFTILLLKKIVIRNAIPFSFGHHMTQMTYFEVLSVYKALGEGKKFTLSSTITALTLNRMLCAYACVNQIFHNNRNRSNSRYKEILNFKNTDESPPLPLTWLFLFLKVLTHFFWSTGGGPRVFHYPFGGCIVGRCDFIKLNSQKADSQSQPSWKWRPVII